MSVYKRRLCGACGKEYHDQTVAKKGGKETPPLCSCGAETRYLAKWCVCVKLPGKDGVMKPHKKSVGTKEEAKAYEASLIDRKSKGEVFSKPKDTTYLHAAKIFLDWVDEREAEGKLAPGSASSYRYRTRVHLTPFFTGKDIRNIEWEDVDEYKQYRRTQIIEEGRGKGGYPTNATINREIATLKRMMSIAVQKRIIKHSLLVDYELLREDNERERYLTHTEIDKLLAECSRRRMSVLTSEKEIAVYPAHLRIAAILGLNTGLRIDGVLTLRWEEIDWDRNEIVKMVKHHRDGAAKPVRIPMTPTLRDELKKWKARSNVVRAKGYVIPSPKKPGDHIKITSNFGLQRALAAVGIEDFTFHDFRHTFCTLFLEAFPDKIEVLRKIVGHSSSYMTRRYAHITERSTHAAMADFTIGGQ
jgi:integrase